MKIVINTCYGGFGLSEKAILRLYELGMIEIATPIETYFPDKKEREKSLKRWGDGERNFMCGAVISVDEKFVLYSGQLLDFRDDPRLIQVIEELGEEANGQNASLQIVEHKIQYEIEDRDGKERVWF